MNKKIRHDLSIEEDFLYKSLVEESVWLVISRVVVFFGQSSDWPKVCPLFPPPVLNTMSAADLSLIHI